MTAHRIERILTLDIDEPTLSEVFSTFGRSGDYRIERSLRSLAELSDENEPACIVARLASDATRPEALFEHLKRSGLPQSVVYLIEGTDVRAVVDAMRRGAVMVLDWPTDSEKLAEALREASTRTARRRGAIDDRRRIFAQLSQLSPGERDVLDFLLQGASNKIVARRLGVSLRTIEARRKNLFVKMQSRSLAELVARLHHADLLEEWATRNV